jgi:hypothetical protein
VILLLVALPTSYQPFISTHGHDKTLSFPIIVARLLQEEDLTKPPHENGTSLAFFVNNKRKFNNNKKNWFNNLHKGGANASTHEPKIAKDKSMVECYYSHKKKHFASK